MERSLGDYAAELSTYKHQPVINCWIHDDIFLQFSRHTTILI